MNSSVHFKADVQIHIAFHEDKHRSECKTLKKGTEHLGKLHFQTSPATRVVKKHCFEMCCYLFTDEDDCKAIPTHMPLFHGKTVKQKMALHPMFNLLCL